MVEHRHKASIVDQPLVTGVLGINSGLPCVSALLSTPPKRRRSRPNFFRTAVHSGLNFPRIQNVNARIDPGLDQKIGIAIAIQREESPRARSKSITFLCRPRTLVKGRPVARLVRHGVAEPLEVRHLQLLFNYW